MPCSPCQESLPGLVNKLNLKPNQWIWVMAGGWSPKPLPKDTLNLGVLVTLVPFHLCWCHSIFRIKTCPHDQQTSRYGGRCPSLALRQEIRNEARHQSEAGTEARENESYGQLHPCHLCFCQIMDLRVIGARHQLHHQCHQCLRGWEDWGIHAMANTPAGNQEATWKSTCQSLKTRTPRIRHLIKLALGLNSVSSCWVSRLHPSPLCHLFITRLPWGVSEKFRDGHHPWWCPHHIRQTLQQCQGLGCFEPRTLPAVYGWKGDGIRLRSKPIQTPSDSSSIIPRMLPSRLHSQIKMWSLLWQTP